MTQHGDAVVVEHQSQLELAICRRRKAIAHGEDVEIERKRAWRVETVSSLLHDAHAEPWWRPDLGRIHFLQELDRRLRVIGEMD